MDIDDDDNAGIEEEMDRGSDMELQDTLEDDDVVELEKMFSGMEFQSEKYKWTKITSNHYGGPKTDFIDETNLSQLIRLDIQIKKPLMYISSHHLNIPSLDLLATVDITQ